jgi:hypothetical protein
MPAYLRLTFLTFVTLLTLLSTTLTAYVAPSRKQPVALPQGDGTGVARLECWDDGSVDPCHRDFYGVDRNAINMPQTDTLYGVAAISPTNVWAVGSNDTLLHYDGTTWQEETYDSLPNSTVKRDFLDISFLSDTDGWAVGNDLIVRWNGSHWQEVDNNSGEQGYRGVAALSATDVWVVGSSVFPQRSVIRHWDGSTWSDVPHPSATSLETIAMVDSNTGMAGGYRLVGPYKDYDSVILRWNGSEWSEVHAPDISYIEDIILENAHTGWALGTDRIVRLEAGKFMLFDFIGGRSISFSTPTSGWVVGRKGYRWDGTQWNYDQTFPQVANDSLLFADGTGWAVGEEGAIYYLEPLKTLYLPRIEYNDSAESINPE